MSIKVFIAALMLFVLGLWMIITSPAQADHIQPPVLPGLCGLDVSICPTPVILKAKERRIVTYRLDEGTAIYPGFRQQARRVADAWAEAIKVEARELTEGTPDIWLTFPADAEFLRICGDGAAGCIQYWADPVMVYFRRALLYNSETGWLTPLSHEGITGGHALGLHERYDDRNFRCIPNPTPPTVMSCGSGIWIPQAFDVEWVCYVLATSWCGQPVSPAPYQDCTTYPNWEGTVSCFWPEYDAWLWLIIDAQGREQLWEFSPTNPRWRCTRGCPT